MTLEDSRAEANRQRDELNQRADEHFRNAVTIVDWDGIDKATRTSIISGMPLPNLAGYVKHYYWDWPMMRLTEIS